MTEEEIIKAHYVKLGQKGGEAEKQRWASMSEEERQAWRERNRQAGKKGGRPKTVDKHHEGGTIDITAGASH